MLIYLKGLYTILGNIKSEIKTVKFNVPNEDKDDINVTIKPEEKEIECRAKYNISDELYEALKNYKEVEMKNLKNGFQDKILNIRSDLSNASKKVISLIKYLLYCEDLDENLISIQGVFYSVDEENWYHLPMRANISVSASLVKKLNKGNIDIIQEYLNNGIKPFLALKHLHRAKTESNPRYKWIDATIAAELAIKEFIIRYQPEIETILLELPSPPLYKLYGRILESMIGERSPKYKELNEGSSIRNKLIHRPEVQKISLDKANKYVIDVEIAIYHLLNILYPDNPIINEFYSFRGIVKNN
ncbi:hypothetical protein U472_11495 [Orenia metallireducens]|uniref:Apea-like HEPN domain-containing protein n=1 Tax=Orenia metallireducens TaxID=1413210 RepID=A0A1C0A8Q5_9FIRM|nr:hypothetical protein [Orenia metallireducens]OCL26601.1 hypothetical protein U472_11495 [Orenia metallireducens]